MCTDTKSGKATKGLKIKRPWTWVGNGQEVSKGLKEGCHLIQQKDMSEYTGRILDRSEVILSMT